MQDKITLTITNPNVAANANITLPDGEAADAILDAELIDSGNYTDAATVAPIKLAVVAAAPAAGQIQLVNPSTVQVGNATNNGFQTLVVRIRRMGAKQKTTYSTAGVTQSGFGM